jgi:hypothetical protein
MPADPNARGNKILEDILKAMNKQNDLLAAQNKILDKMEKHARPQPLMRTYPYLERSDGTTGSGASDSQSDAGSDGSLQGGDSDSLR